MVAGPEIADIRHLEIAHLGAAFVLRVAGGRVLLRVFPAMMQQQQHGHGKECDRRDIGSHAIQSEFGCKRHCFKREQHDERDIRTTEKKLGCDAQDSVRDRARVKRATDWFVIPPDSDLLH